MFGPRLSEPCPTVSEIAAIAAEEDAGVRNLRITDCYARLSAALREHIGEGANWCSFATWASRQAGCTIRGEDLEDRLAELLKGKWQARQPLLGICRFLLRRALFRPKSWLGRIVLGLQNPFNGFKRASEAVAAGNRTVFEEIGREFARYIEAPDFAVFLAALTPGPPPDGQGCLRRAFRHYHEARLETRPGRRAQLMLLANLEVGIHEQTRLQPDIRRAMEAVADSANHLETRPAAVRLMRMALAPVVAHYRRVVRRAISETLVVLHMPDNTLLLCDNLTAAIPAVFRRIDEPALLELLSAIEPTACENCGADDWADLHERIHYVSHLFRAYHENPAVFDAPFTPAQTDAIRGGRLPGGRLSGPCLSQDASDFAKEARRRTGANGTAILSRPPGGGASTTSPAGRFVLTISSPQGTQPAAPGIDAAAGRGRRGAAPCQ